MEQLRFTVAGYYGFGNLGDEAILSSMIADFRRVFPQAVFEIVCADYSPTISGPDITTVPWKDWPRAIESVRDCDWLIVGGGGIFTYHLNYSKEDFLRQSESFAAFIFGLPVLAHLLGKRSFLYAIGASRMESAAALEHARAAARLADACTVRDARSREILGASVEDRLRIQEYADPAFRLENEPLPAAALAEAGIRSDEPIVAIVARNWETSDTKALWEGLTTEVLRDFAVSHSIRLLFIPFHATSDTGNDLNNDPAVIGRMRDVIGRERTAELAHGLRPGQVSAVLAHCQMAVSIRLHGAILAVRNATPVVALDYDPKVSLVMSGRDLGRFVTPMPEDAMGAERLKRLLEETWTNRESIRGALQKTASKAAADAGDHLERLRIAVSGQEQAPRTDRQTHEFLARTAGEQTLRLAEAEAQARRASNEAQSLRTGIRRLVDDGKMEAALTMLRAWLPDRREALAEREYLLGFCLQTLGREAGTAREHYNKALELGFDEFWTLYHRSQSSFLLGEYRAALADLTRAAALRPEHAELPQLLEACSLAMQAPADRPAVRRVKAEFHIPISPTSDFLIRTHYLAASIDRFSGLDRSDYRIVVTVGAKEVEDLNRRCPWSRLYPLEWRWVSPAVFRQKSYYATAVDRFTHPMDADVGVLLDADVLVCGALDRWIEEIADGDMLHGLPGHFSPFYYSPSGRPHRESWEAIFREAGLPAPRFDMQHLGWGIIHTDVPEESEMRYSPTFFNLGVLAARSDVLAAVGSSIYDAMEAVDRFQQTFFKCQIGLTLAMALHGIRGALLAARYNFLNTPEMFDKLPEEAADVRIFHFNQPADIDKVRDFASYGRLQKALRREELHAVNRILVERLRSLHYDRVLKDLQAAGMELPVEPDVDHWDVRQAVQRARVSVDCGSYEEALDALTPVESHLTEDGHAQYLLGYTKHALGRDRLAAIEHYGNALRCRFDEFWVRYNRGALALDLDLREQALEDLSRARTLQPDHPGPITLLSALTPT